MAFQNISRGSGNTSYYSPTGSKKYFEWPFTDKQYIKDWELGLPLTITDYDQNNNIVSVTTNTYTPQPLNTSAQGKIENFKILGVTDMNGANLDSAETEAYYPVTGASLLARTETKKYLSNTTFITDEVNYTYDERNNPATIVTTNSRGESFKLKNVYNYNVSGTGVLYGGTAGTLHDMTDDGLEFNIGMERWKISPTNAPYNDELYDASITKYQYQNGKVFTQKLYTLRSLDPISYSSYTGMTMGGPLMNQYGKILSAYNTTSPIDGFQQASEVLQFDSKGNPVETKISDRQPVFKSMIWDPATGNKLAEANCRLNEMAYSGFESTNKGNWSYNQANVQAPPSSPGNIDGSNVLVANSSNAAAFLSVSNLTLNKEYVLTFWSKGGIIHITGGGITGDIPYSLLYGDATNQPGGWRYYQAKFTPVNNNPIEFKLVATGSPFTNYIDDVRLFPASAIMQSWTYAPMVGTVSSTDAQGRITYYLHDALGRQTAVKDQDGHVISKQERHLGQ
jgi:YD repeat-containing protein